MPALIAALIGVTLYGAACYLTVVFIVGPAWPFLIIGAGGIGILLVFVMLAGTLLRARGLEADSVTPLDVRAAAT